MANQILAGAVINAGQVIAGVDASNPPYVGPPVAKWVTRSVSGNPRTLYIRSVMDLDADPTSLVNTNATFGGYNDSAVDSNGRYYAVRGAGDTENGVVFVYDTQDLSAEPIALTPDSGESPYNQNYSFGYSLAMSDDKLFVGNNAQGVPVYAYDLTDLSAPPSKISTPATYHGGEFKFSFDMTANSTHLFIGHPYSREPINSSDNNTEAGAVHVYDLETLQYQTSLFGFDGEYGDQFGSEVKATDTHLAVGAHGDDEVNGTQYQNGAVYVFDATDLSATPTKVMPLTSGYSDEFGRAISLSDTHLAVSEPNDDTKNSNSGALHIYNLNNLSNPTIAYGTLHSEYYGNSPILFNDGSNRISFSRRFQNLGLPTKYFVYHINDLDTPLWESETEQVYAFLPAYVAPPPPPPSAKWMVAGAPRHYGTNTRGAAYVYDATDLSVSPILLENPEISGSQFAREVFVANDKIFLGSPEDNGGRGAVYVYDATDLSAAPTKVTAPNGLGNDRFGRGIYATSDTLAVGAWYDDIGGLSNVGSVYIYDLNDLSAAPTQLTGTDAEVNDKLGKSVSMSDDYIVGGAYGVNDSGGVNSGAVYVWDKSDLSAAPTKLIPNPNAVGDSQQLLGYNVSLHGNTLIASNHSYNGYQGEIYVYDMTDLSAAPTQLTAPDGEPSDFFGAGDDDDGIYVYGNTIVIGAKRDNNNFGSVYVYDATDLSAAPTVLYNPDTGGLSANPMFGGSVSIFGDTLVVGSENATNSDYNSGAVYIYDLTDLSAAPTKFTPPNETQSVTFGEAISVG